MLDVLVNVDEARDDAAIIRLGMDIARRHRGFVTGLRIVDAYPLAIAIPGALVVLDAEEREAKEQRAWWDGLCRRHKVAGAWEVIRGIRLPILARRSCLADLTIDRLPSAGNGMLVSMDNVTRTLLAGTSPMLLVPSVWNGSLRQARILVAWNSSAESTRAVRAALPFLRAAEQIRILDGACDESPGLLPPPLPLAGWLTREGVPGRVVKRLASTGHVGEALLDEACAMDADLLVMGAWGHSRIGEWLLGGATHHVLREANLPVLLAH